MCHWGSCRSLHSTSNLYHDVIATKSEQVDGILFSSFYYKYSCNEYSFFFCLHVHNWKYISRRNTWKIPQLIENLISVDILPSKFLFSFVFSLVKYENIYFLIISTKTEHLNFYVFLFYYIFHFVYFSNQTEVIFYKFFVYWWNWMFFHMLFPFVIFLQIIFYNTACFHWTILFHSYFQLSLYILNINTFYINIKVFYLNPLLCMLHLFPL